MKLVENKKDTSAVEKVKRVFNLNAGLYTEVVNSMPDTVPEKRVVLEKLTEAGMWLRMIIEMHEPITVAKAEVKDNGQTPRSN